MNANHDRASPHGDTPFVSVVIPTRNRARSLERAVASVLAQSLEHLELIVVDDASSDPTPAVIEEIRARDQRVRAIRQPVRAGAAAARNAGIESARAPWLAFLDDDDEWMPDKLRHQLQLAKQTGAPVLVHAPVLAVRVHGADVLLGGGIDGGDPCDVLFDGNRIPTPGVLVDRAAVASVGGFDPAMPRLQDWDLWLRLCGRMRFIRDDALLARTFQSGERISTNSQALREAAERLASKYPDNVRLRLTLAHMLVVEGERDAGVRLLRRAVSDRPESLGPRLRLALASVAPVAYRALAHASEWWKRPPTPANPWGSGGDV